MAYNKLAGIRLVFGSNVVMETYFDISLGASLVLDQVRTACLSHRNQVKISFILEKRNGLVHRPLRTTGNSDPLCSRIMSGSRIRNFDARVFHVQHFVEAKVRSGNDSIRTVVPVQFRPFGFRVEFRFCIGG